MLKANAEDYASNYKAIFVRMARKGFTQKPNGCVVMKDPDFVEDGYEFIRHGRKLYKVSKVALLYMLGGKAPPPDDTPELTKKRGGEWHNDHICHNPPCCFCTMHSRMADNVSRDACHKNPDGAPCLCGFTTGVMCKTSTTAWESPSKMLSVANEMMKNGFKFSPETKSAIRELEGEGFESPAAKQTFDELTSIGSPLRKEDPPLCERVPVSVEYWNQRPFPTYTEGKLSEEHPMYQFVLKALNEEGECLLKTRGKKKARAQDESSSSSSDDRRSSDSDDEHFEKRGKGKKRAKSS